MDGDRAERTLGRFAYGGELPFGEAGQPAVETIGLKEIAAQVATDADGINPLSEEQCLGSRTASAELLRAVVKPLNLVGAFTVQAGRRGR